MRYIIKFDPEMPRCQLLQVHFDRSDFEIWEDQFFGPNHNFKEHVVRYHWVEQKCRILHPLINSNFEIGNDLIVEINDEYFFLHKTVRNFSPLLHAASYDDCVHCDMHYFIDLCPKWEPLTQYVNCQCCRDSGNESDSEVNEGLKGLEMNWLNSDKL